LRALWRKTPKIGLKTKQNKINLTSFQHAKKMFFLFFFSDKIVEKASSQIHDTK